MAAPGEPSGAPVEGGVRVLVCGSRSWTDYAAIGDFVSFLPHGSVIVHGGAMGADTTAENYARQYHVQTEVHLADWDQYGKRAGILRNLAMLDTNPDSVVAFWDGKSRGTKHTIDEARRRGIPVDIVSDTASDGSLSDADSGAPVASTPGKTPAGQVGDVPNHSPAEAREALGGVGEVDARTSPRGAEASELTRRPGFRAPLPSKTPAGVEAIRSALGWLDMSHLRRHDVAEAALDALVAELGEARALLYEWHDAEEYTDEQVLARWPNDVSAKTIRWLAGVSPGTEAPGEAPTKTVGAPDGGAEA